MTDENGETPVSRRDLFKAGVIGAGLAAYAGMGSEEAMAQTTSERLLNLGDDELYQIDRDGNDNLIIRHKDNGEILKYDPVSDEITTPRAIGSSTQPVPKVTADQRTVNDLSGRGSIGSSQTVSTSTVTQVNIDTVEHEDTDAVDVDTTNDKLIANLSGIYFISGLVTFAGSANWTAGDRILARIKVGGTIVVQNDIQHGGANNAMGIPLPVTAVEVTSPPTDIIMEAYHERGGDESLLNSVRANQISAIHGG